jgi:hypothetical protein
MYLSFLFLFFIKSPLDHMGHARGKNVLNWTWLTAEGHFDRNFFSHDKFDDLSRLSIDKYDLVSQHQQLFNQSFLPTSFIMFRNDLRLVGPLCLPNSTPSPPRASYADCTVIVNLTVIFDNLGIQHCK